MCLGKGSLYSVVQAVKRIILSQSVGKIIIILSFRVGSSQNKNIDHRGKACVMFGLVMQNKNSAINVFLPFLIDFFCHNISIFNKIIFLQH